MRNKLFINALLVAIALSSCGVGQNNNKDQENQQSIMVDQKKSVSLEDRDGRSISLADYNGEKIYIKYWASTCPICLAGLEEFDQLSSESNDYKIISVVSPGHRGEKSKDEFIRWFDGLGYDNIEILYDTSGEFIEEFDIKKTPTNIFIDSKGDLIEIAPGAIEADKIKRILDMIS